MKRISFIIVLTCICLTAKSQYNKGVVLESVLKTDTTSIGQKIVYPTFANDEVSIVKVTLPPGKSTGWHKHFFPVFAYVLKGTLTVEVENKKTLQFPVNSSFSDIYSKVDGMLIYWRGVVADEKVSTLKKQKESTDNMIKNLKTYVEKLRQITENYETAENTSVAEAGELPSNILE